MCIPLTLQRRTLANVRDPVWWVMRVLDKAFFCVLIMSLFWHRGSLLDPASASNIISLLWMLALLPLFYTAFYLELLVYEMPVFLRCAGGFLFKTACAANVLPSSCVRDAAHMSGRGI